MERTGGSTSKKKRLSSGTAGQGQGGGGHGLSLAINGLPPSTTNFPSPSSSFLPPPLMSENEYALGTSNHNEDKGGAERNGAEGKGKGKKLSVNGRLGLGQRNGSGGNGSGNGKAKSATPSPTTPTPPRGQGQGHTRTGSGSGAGAGGKRGLSPAPSSEAEDDKTPTTATSVSTMHSSSSSMTSPLPTPSPSRASFALASASSSKRDSGPYTPTTPFTPNSATAHRLSGILMYANKGASESTASLQSNRPAPPSPAVSRRSSALVSPEMEMMAMGRAGSLKRRSGEGLMKRLSQAATASGNNSNEHRRSQSSSSTGSRKRSGGGKRRSSGLITSLTSLGGQEGTKAIEIPSPAALNTLSLSRDPDSPEVAIPTSSPPTSRVGSQSYFPSASSSSQSTVTSPASINTGTTSQIHPPGIITIHPTPPSASLPYPEIRVCDFAFSQGTREREGRGPMCPRTNRLRVLNFSNPSRYSALSGSGVMSPEEKQKGTGMLSVGGEEFAGFKFGRWSWALKRDAGVDDDDEEDEDDYGEDEYLPDSGYPPEEEDADGFLAEESPFYPGVYRAMYAFEPEPGSSELALVENQLIRAVGRGGGVGWVVVVVEPDEGLRGMAEELTRVEREHRRQRDEGGEEGDGEEGIEFVVCGRDENVEGEEEGGGEKRRSGEGGAMGKHALVPESYLELVRADGDEDDGSEDEDETG